MTDTTTEPDYTTLDPELNRCSFQLLINVYDVTSLREGLTRAAVNVGQYGLSAFYIVATDPDTGDQWVVEDGRITPMDAFEAAAKENEPEEEPDPALEQAVDRIVEQQQKEGDGDDGA